MLFSNCRYPGDAGWSPIAWHWHRAYESRSAMTSKLRMAMIIALPLRDMSWRFSPAYPFDHPGAVQFHHKKEILGFFGYCALWRLAVAPLQKAGLGKVIGDKADSSVKVRFKASSFTSQLHIFMPSLETVIKLKKQNRHHCGGNWSSGRNYNLQYWHHQSVPSSLVSHSPEG